MNWTEITGWSKTHDVLGPGLKWYFICERIVEDEPIHECLIELMETIMWIIAWWERGTAYSSKSVYV